MQRRRAITLSDGAVYRARTKTGETAGLDRAGDVSSSTGAEVARDESGRLPRAERDRQALLRRHLLAMAAEKRLPTVARAGSVAEEHTSQPPQQPPFADGSRMDQTPGPLDEVVMDQRRSGAGRAETRSGQRRVLAPSARAQVVFGGSDRV